jgi:Flp pilus assembly protein TadD
MVKMRVFLNIREYYPLIMAGEEEEQIEEAEAMYHVVVAEVLRELGYQDRAEESYMKAVSIDPWNSQIRVRYSAFLAHTGRISAALAELEDVLAAEPGNTFARLNYALALEQRRDFTGAAAAAQECLRAEPTSSELWCTLGRLMERTGAEGDAISCYRASIGFNGENAKPHYELGNLLLRLGDPDAEAELLEAVLLDPKDMAAACSYGAALEQNGSLDGPADRLRRLVAVEPGNATARYRYGIALEKLGRLDQASGQYAAAVSLDPGHSDACLALAVLLQRTESQKDAAECLEKASDGRLGQEEIDEIICEAADTENMQNAYFYHFE